MKRKKLRDQIIFWITWSPSLLRDQAIETKKFILPINRWLYTQRGENSLEEILEGNERRQLVRKKNHAHLNTSPLISTLIKKKHKNLIRRKEGKK